MSLIYFKLKNAIQQQSVTFDGSVIQIGDVKRLVAERQGLGPEGYQEITLYDPNTGNEYDDDSKVIPRNTLVEVKRTPAATFAPLTSNPGGVAVAVENEPAPMVQDDESQALQNLMQGTASTWQREVRQGVMKGRGGRGRGAVPAEYRCPRCEVYGAHWLQDCPTHGDPTYDRKRVRPPVGIPMTRLARSSEGGLVLPDGNTGTLVANEDAFAKEILGIGAVNGGGNLGGDVLAIEGAGRDDGQNREHMQGASAKAAAVPHAVGFMPFSISAMGAPQLAGMGLKLKKDTKSTALSEKDERLFELMKYPELPKGPRDFILKAYDRDEPLSREEFEKEQDHYNYKKGSGRGSQRVALQRRDRSQSRSDRRDRRRSRSQSRSRSRSERHREYRRRSRSRSRSRDRYDDSRRRRRGDKDDDSRHRRDGYHRSRPSRSKSPKRSSQKTSEQVSKKISSEKSKKETTKSDVGEGSLQETKSTKHSPIRWSQPPSKEGAKFAGQDEEPDIDYGESEEEANDVPLKMTEKRKDKKRDDANKKSSGSKRGQQRSGRDSREKDYDGRARKYEDDRYRGGESPRRRGGDDDDRGSGRRKGKDKDYGRSNNKGRNRNARR